MVSLFSRLAIYTDTYIFFTYQTLVFWCMFINEVLIFVATSITTLSSVTSLLFLDYLSQEVTPPLGSKGTHNVRVYHRVQDT